MNETKRNETKRNETKRNETMQYSCEQHVLHLSALDGKQKRTMTGGINRNAATAAVARHNAMVEYPSHTQHHTATASECTQKKTEASNGEPQHEVRTLDHAWTSEVSYR